MEIEDYLGENGFFAEDGSIYIRRLNEDDKEDFMRLKVDVSCIPKAYEIPSFYDFSWNDYLNGEDLVLCLISKDSGKFLGVVMLKNLHDETQEIGIDIVREFRNRGIGFQAISLLLERAKECSGKTRYQIRIYSDNIASQKLFNKFNITEIAHEDNEFIQVMKSFEKTIGSDYIANLKEQNQEMFEKAEKKYIALYELKIPF